MQPPVERQFNYKVSPEIGIQNPNAIPLCVLRMIYSIMSEDPTGTLEQRYDKAFKIAVSSFASRNLLLVRDGGLMLSGDGVNKEVEAKTKQDSIYKNVKFTEWMREINKNRASMQGKKAA